DPIAMIKVEVNSREVAVIDTGRLDPQSDFHTIDSKVALVEGKNPVKIRMYDRGGNMVQNPSMIIRRLRISPPGDASPLDDILRKINNQK
ncbi:MAG: hypothetical protein WCO94_03110, partial [Verrucomicrobiota bacterium]